MAQRVSAVLLAAGSSKRMGQPKQLLPLEGRPAIRYSCERILSAGVAELTVVIGPHGKEIVEALHGLPVNFVVNQDNESEMADSIRIGQHIPGPSQNLIESPLRNTIRGIGSIATTGRTSMDQRPNMNAFISNLRTPMPLWKKISLFLRNSGIKIRKRQSCCGHPGEPGC